MESFSNLVPRGPSSPCDDIHPEGNTVDIAAQTIQLQGRTTLLFIAFIAACVGFVCVLLILVWSFFGRAPKANGLHFRMNHGLKGWTSLTGIMILTLVFFLADAVFRFLRYRHYTVGIVYLWAEEVREKPQSCAEFWLFVLVFASFEEAAELGSVAQRGGAQLLGQTARLIIVILAILAFLAEFAVGLAHKYFLVDSLDPSNSEDPKDCHLLTIASTIFISVSIGVYGLMAATGIYGTIIAAGFSTNGKHSGFHRYRRYWSVLIGAFLARSILGLTYVMIFDWFNMGPYDLLSMIYAITYAATTIVIFFCIARLVQTLNPVDEIVYEPANAIPLVYGPPPWSFKQPPGQYIQIPSNQHINQI